MEGLVGVIKAACIKQHDAGRRRRQDAASAVAACPATRVLSSSIDTQIHVGHQRSDSQETVHASIKSSLAEVIRLMDEPNARSADIVGGAKEKACALRFGLREHVNRFSSTLVHAQR